MDITALKSAHDIVQVIGRTVQLKKSGSRFVGLCPLHVDTNPSLVVYPSKQAFRCFGCNAHGDIIEWLMLTFNVGFKTACNLLSGLPKTKSQPLFKPQPKRFRTISRDAAKYWHSRLGKRRDYYYGRGFIDEVIDREQLGWSGRRYVIPLWTGVPQESILAAVKLRRDDEGEVRRLQENGLDEEASRNALKLLPKYILKGSYEPLLYNCWAVEGKEEIWIFFGELDAALAMQLGLPACSPVHGANGWVRDWGRTHLRSARRINIFPDRGEEDQGGRVKAMIGGHSKVLSFPDGDWSDFGEFILAGHHAEELKGE